MAWAGGRLDMFLSPASRSASRNLLHGIVTLSGKKRRSCWPNAIAGTEEAFANVMNENAKRLGLTNSHFGNSNGWPDEGADLCHSP
jgi:D-alanyl-D-alanine carboxypeptidase (penicillin-binding protein 5/6)